MTHTVVWRCVNRAASHITFALECYGKYLDVRLALITRLVQAQLAAIPEAADVLVQVGARGPQQAAGGGAAHAVTTYGVRTITRTATAGTNELLHRCPGL